ncbi:ribosomal RNA small subunit methyltransferase E [mine drainage metagenome]|uniref:16S rRNA (uracil(1498)-N(3))-methyltransferase n=1 Tax=mine drainage metagenome TaxID=410659 RepID=A0A1J5SVX1_9ZZZZ
MLTVRSCGLNFVAIIVSIEYFCFMSVPFFYEQNIATTDSQFILSEETSKHCVQVLRMKIGEQLNITDGKGNLFSATIISTDKRSCAVKINATTFSKQQQRKVSIAISLIKNASRFEWFLEKATEMGVCEIIPLLCHRTERQHFRFDRMNNILIAAMLQSQQTWLPVLQGPTAFQTVTDQSQYTQKLIAHCEENKKTELKDLQLMDDVQILIGPEGDFTSDEIQTAIQKNYQPVSLGNTRLRTETAGAMASALLLNL